MFNFINYFSLYRQLKYNKLRNLVPYLRRALIIYSLFNTLFLVQDAIDGRQASHYAPCYALTILFIIPTFFLTFTRYLYTHWFSLIVYIYFLVQSASNSLYLYGTTKSEQPPISPFLPIDIFFLFFIAKLNMGATLLCSIIAIMVNEIIVADTLHPDMYPIFLFSFSLPLSFSPVSLMLFYFGSGLCTAVSHLHCYWLFYW